MEQYPVLDIYEKNIYQNAETLLKLCTAHGITPCAVVKGFCNCMPVTRQLVKAGFRELASSRVRHLAELKEAMPDLSTLLLRIPMACEIPDVVTYCDACLVSEQSTIRLLNEEAVRQGKRLKVILMRDVGDLREGIFDPDAFVETAVRLEWEAPGLYLYGVGCNLTCYGSVMPTQTNLGELCRNAEEIEARIGRTLDVISGGSTSSIPLLFQNTMPERINHLRIGEALVVPWDLFYTWNCPSDGMTNHTLVLRAQIIECNVKPTKPIGQQGINCFGSYREYEDRGVRKRAILGMGEYDYGSYEKLVPLDPKVQVLGASSDHTIVDIQDSEQNYHVGDIMEFELRYQSMLFTTANPLVYKQTQ